MPRPKTLRLLRALAILVPLAGILTGLVDLALIWSKAPADYSSSVYDTGALIGALLVLVMALLIAWRAGDYPSNVTLALALGFIFTNDAVATLFSTLGPDHSLLAKVLVFGTFFLGASLFIRTPQVFPRPLTASDLAASPTVWGKVRPLRALLTFLLHAPAVWGLVAVITILGIVLPNAEIGEALRISIMVIGLVYFYVSFRSGDAESRRKVLWFFEAVLLAVVLALIALGVRTALGTSVTPDIRMALNIGFISLNTLALVGCIGAAIFYAGAVSPALVVRKTLVYGATISALLFLFAAVEIYVVEHLVEWLEVTDHIASALMGAAFGFAFHPLKHRLEHLLHRFAPQETTGNRPHPAAATVIATDLQRATRPS